MDTSKKFLSWLLLSPENDHLLIDKHKYTMLRFYKTLLDLSSEVSLLNFVSDVTIHTAAAVKERISKYASPFNECEWMNTVRTVV